MAGSTYTINIDVAALRNAVSPRADLALKNAAGISVDRTKQNIVDANNIDVGRLYQSISAWFTSETNRAVAYIGTELFYAKWVNRGRGWVFPRRAKMLRFKPKGSGVFIFAKQARPYAGSRFLDKAQEALRDSDFRV